MSWTLRLQQLIKIRYRSAICVSSLGINDRQVPHGFLSLFLPLCTSHPTAQQTYLPSVSVPTQLPTVQLVVLPSVYPC
ncbi:hypothetical protein MJO29_009129 [Puccinia striiformis f. sp. tritici]|nr:hypothetical protein MJO29_009129 [Puccinia striiformis f. sp. tritici]